MVHSMAPLCLAGAMASPAGETVVICTAHGPETVRIGADGAKLPGAPPATDLSLSCIVCAIFHGGVPVLPGSTSVPLSFAEVKSDLASVSLPVLRAPFSYRTRAPPRMMLIIEA